MWSKLGPVKPRRPNSFAAILALVAVLFSQLAVSAYACPGVDGMAKAAVAADEVPPCHENPGPAGPTPLCQAHCQQGDQSFDLRAASLASIAMPALPVSWLPVPAVAEPASEIPEPQASLLERPTGPPLAVRHCCLRI
jgi:hypothetical protein